MGSENIWRHAKSVFSNQRYHGVSRDRTEKTSPEWSNQIEGQENIEGNTKAETIAHEPSIPPKPHWINGVLLCAKATTALLLLNIIFIAVAAGLSNGNAENSAFSSFQVMYKVPESWVLATTACSHWSRRVGKKLTNITREVDGLTSGARV
ncbi:unnamed protein product [Penicillium viridicatum]